MADGTKIEWTDATWNPITGCSVASPGCTNCYAMKLAGTRLQHHPSRAGLTRDTKAGPVWTGETRFNEGWLDQPLRWGKPRMIFVTAHGDLFHESVPDEWIDRVFAVMALAPQHTFQVLTKRARRARDYLSTRAGDWMIVWPDANPPGCLPISRHAQRQAMQGKGWPDALLRPTFPLPNVWLGVSVEDQARADERIPELLATPAAVRWLSCEPLLGPVDLESITLSTATDPFDALCGMQWTTQPARYGGGRLYNGATRYGKLDWIVVGGESGHGARPMHPDWARSLRDQCVEAGVPFLFEQGGEWFPYGEIDADGHQNSISKGEGAGVWYEWPDARGFSVRVGKKRAGRLLDGVEHNGFPQVRHVPHA